MNCLSMMKWLEEGGLAGVEHDEWQEDSEVVEVLPSVTKYGLVCKVSKW